MSDTKTCPFCAEDIKAAAVKCKHCGEFLEPAATSSAAEEEHSPEEYSEQEIDSAREALDAMLPPGVVAAPLSEVDAKKPPGLAGPREAKPSDWRREALSRAGHDAPAASSGQSSGMFFPGLMVAAGVCLFIYATTMDVMVGVESNILGIERVANIHLMNEQKNYQMAGGFLSVLGLALGWFLSPAVRGPAI